MTQVSGGRWVTVHCWQPTDRTYCTAAKCCFWYSIFV